MDNGTFIDSRSFPHFGYSEQDQLEDRNERRRYGLGPVPRMPKIDDPAARRNSLIGVDGLHRARSDCIGARLPAEGMGC